MSHVCVKLVYVGGVGVCGRGGILELFKSSSLDIHLEYLTVW